MYFNKKEFCTAKEGASFCQLEAVNRWGKKYFKMPKLADLYEHLFSEKPDAAKLHDALYDVHICLRCFYKMRYDLDLWKVDQRFWLQEKDPTSLFLQDKKWQYKNLFPFTTVETRRKSVRLQQKQKINYFPKKN
jgi:hypothetical protein